MKIKQLKSNMTELTIADGTQVLFSYETPVASYQYASGLKKTDKKWSQTTTKHVNQWIQDMGYNPKDIPSVDQDYFTNLVKQEV